MWVEFGRHWYEQNVPTRFLPLIKCALPQFWGAGDASTPEACGSPLGLDAATSRQLVKSYAVSMRQAFVLQADLSDPPRPGSGG